MGDELEYCKNCKRTIAASNYVIHSAHCERNIQLCVLCSEPVPRREMEEHMENSHAVEACSYCSERMEKWMLEDHKESCPKLPVACEFCELEFPRDCMEEHISACGSRTNKCSVCHQYVMLRNMESHQRVCGKESCSVLPVVECDFCELKFPIDCLEQHSAACGARSEKCSNCHQYIMLRNMESHQIVCREEAFTSNFVKCRFCQREFLHDMLDDHVSFCKSKNTKCPDCGEIVKGYLAKHICEKELGNMKIVRCILCDKKFPTDILAVHITDCRSRLDRGAPALELRTCEYCQAQISSNIFETHVTNCKSKSKRCPDCGETVKRYIDKHNCQKVSKRSLQKCEYCNLAIPSDIFQDHVDTCGRVPKQCRLCNETFLRKNENQHFCRKAPSKLKGLCHICKQEIPYVDLNVHLYACALTSGKKEFNDGAMKDNIKIRAIELSSPEQKDFADSTSRNKSFESLSSNAYQECKYCQERMPQLIYSAHLESCKQRPYDCKSCRQTVPFCKRRHEDHDCRTNSYHKKHETFRSIYSENSSVPYKCELCLETMPINQKRKHEESECKMIHGDMNNSSNEHYYNRIQNLSDYTSLVPAFTPPVMKNLEKDSKNCPFCSHKIPLDRFQEHVSHCSFERKVCNFCNKVILIAEEDSHLRQCIEKSYDEMREKGRSQEQKSTAINDENKCKKGKKKTNNKGLGGVIERFITNLGSNKEPNASCRAREELYEPGDGIPCEFCNEIFPFLQIIEHQSGCRPDLARFSGASEAKGYTHPEGYRSRENVQSERQLDLAQNTGVYEASGYTSPHSNRSRENYQCTIPDPPKGVKINIVSKKNESEDREMHQQKKSSKVLFTYKAGRREKDDVANDLVRGKSSIIKEDRDSKIKPGEFLSLKYTPSSQAKEYSSTAEETYKTKDYGNNNSLKSYKSQMNSKLRSMHSTLNHEEPKPIGAEREERKGIIQIGKDTVLKSSAHDEPINMDHYTQNVVGSVEERSQSLNSNNTTGSSDDLYMSCEEEGFEDEKSFKNDYEVVAKDDKRNENFLSESSRYSEGKNRINDETLTYALNETLNNNSSYKSNLSGRGLMLDAEEDVDQKNQETFGNDYDADLDLSKYDSSSDRNYMEDIEGKKMSKLRTQWAFSCTDHTGKLLESDSYISRDNDESKKDYDMEAYLQFLNKDDKESDSNEDLSKSASSGTKSCNCGNSVCYCAFNQQSTSPDNVSVVTLDDLQQTTSPDVTVVTLDDLIGKGARSKNANYLPSSFSIENDLRKELHSKLNIKRCASSNVQRENRMRDYQKNGLNSSKEEKQNSDNWTKYREQIPINSDTD